MPIQTQITMQFLQGRYLQIRRFDDRFPLRENSLWINPAQSLEVNKKLTIATSSSTVKIKFRASIMLNEKAPGSVWNVAFVAIALFVAGMALAGSVQPHQAQTITADVN